MKRLLSFILVLMLAVSGTVCASADRLGETETPASYYEDAAVTFLKPVFPQDVTEITSKTVPFYLCDTEVCIDFTLYFMNGADDLPFVNVEDIPTMLHSICNTSVDSGRRYTCSVSGNSLIIWRENNAFVIIDFSDNTIFFSDKTLFAANYGQDIAMDFTNQGMEEFVDAVSLVSMDSYYTRAGASTTLHLDDYQIPMILQDHTGYIPMQVVSDFFLSESALCLLYNGENLLLVAPQVGSITQPLPFDLDNAAPEVMEDLGDVLAMFPQGPMNSLYYNKKNAAKSEALTQLTYNELCMALDYYYGLSEEHKISSFDSLFIETGMYSKILNDNASETVVGLDLLTVNLFRDNHSGVIAQSYLADLTSRSAAAEEGLSGNHIMEHMDRFSASAAKYYPEGIPAYEEIDDTAYITFNQFMLDLARNYHDIDEYTANPNDVVELLLYANKQIHREGSPVRNVVLDLSQNAGGAVNVAIMTLAWLLDGTEITIEHVPSGAEASIKYLFDGNADGEFDTEADALSRNDYSIYCLISPVSFSSGNMVPAVLKNSGFATLIGQRSSGGTCAVHSLSTADGTLLDISGPTKLSVAVNGTFYNVDKGVEPDFMISNPDHFYDRQYLTDWIHQLP